MLPSWYPTKENPFNGCFFREQALAMQKNYNFIVLRYSPKKVLALLYAIKCLLNLNNPKLRFIKDDNGLKEYSLVVYIPQFIIWDLFVERFNLVAKHKKLPEGVGKSELPIVKKSRIKAVKFLQRENKLPAFDCVYSLTSQDMASIGQVFSSVFSVPHITAEHAPFPWPGHVLSDSTKLAMEKADAFLAISSDKIRQVLLQNIHVNPIWVGNLCDETKFSLNTKEHEISSFLIVAANSFYKNYPLFIKSMEELKRIAKKEFKIIIAGYNSNKGYSKNANEFEDKIHSSIINENTELIEAVSREDMPALYNSCEVFVMTSIQEGLPVSALEASMSGLPVISTRCGGVEDYIDDSMGRIFAITDYKGIANACNDFLNGKIAFDRKKIREKTVALFGNDAFVERMKNIFDGVMEK